MTLGALGGAVKPLTRAEVIKLAEDSPVTTLPMLGRALGVSEPVIRAEDGRPRPAPRSAVPGSDRRHPASARHRPGDDSAAPGGTLTVIQPGTAA
jgi:hypothetical protein